MFVPSQVRPDIRTFEIYKYSLCCERGRCERGWKQSAILLKNRQVKEAGACDMKEAGACDMRFSIAITVKQQRLNSIIDELVK